MFTFTSVLYDDIQPSIFQYGKLVLNICLLPTLYICCLNRLTVTSSITQSLIVLIFDWPAFLLTQSTQVSMMTRAHLSLGNPYIPDASGGMLIDFTSPRLSALSRALTTTLARFGSFIASSWDVKDSGKAWIRCLQSRVLAPVTKDWNSRTAPYLS